MILTDQTNQGHSQACSYVLSDDITIKNIAAYRKSPIFATQPIDGISALTFTQQTEFHLARQLDVIVGGRLTKDKKSGIFRHGASLAARNVIPCT